MDHGGDLTEARARFGGGTEDWLDLSTGINPFAYPYAPADLAEGLARLPSREALDKLLGAAAAAYDVPADARILAASGTQALIQWLPVLADAGPVAIFGPTYDEHARSWARAGHPVLACDRDLSAAGQSGQVPPLPAAARHLIVVSPNNPDGHEVDLDTIGRLAGDVARRDGWLVIDESFAETGDGPGATALCARWPVIVLRSFGKFYGLAGLRLGFLIGPPAIVAACRAALGPWSVSTPALTIGTHALADRDWARSMRAHLGREAALLDAVLTGAGLRPAGGTPLYRLTRHDEAGRIHEELAASRIWVRRFDWDRRLLRFGLPPGEAARARLAEALDAAMGRPAIKGLASGRGLG